MGLRIEKVNIDRFREIYSKFYDLVYSNSLDETEQQIYFMTLLEISHKMSFWETIVETNEIKTEMIQEIRRMLIILRNEKVNIKEYEIDYEV